MTIVPYLIAVLLTFAAPVTSTEIRDVDVIGDQLVDQSRRPIQLRGVNRSGIEYPCVQGWGIVDGSVDDVSVAAMRTWGVNSVRIPLNEDCWLGRDGLSPELTGPAYRAAVVSYVDRLVAAGMIVVVDLHWTSTGGELADRQRPMPTRERALDFLASVASVFESHDTVLFDLFNEPHEVSWGCWRDGCGEYAGTQEIVNAVRATGATNPMVLSGLDWGGDLSAWGEYRPIDPLRSLVAGWHLYDFKGCSDSQCWEAVSDGVGVAPIVITEFGDTDCDGGFSRPLMEWADSGAVSYLAWSWSLAVVMVGWVSHLERHQ